MTMITFPAKVVWFKKIELDDIFLNFSKRHQKRLRITLARAETTGTTCVIEPVSSSFLSWFKPYYAIKMAEKNNPNLADIDLILAKYAGKRDCYCLTLYENNVQKGGMILIHKRNRLTIAVKVFDTDWDEEAFPVSPALFSEYYLYQHASAHHYHTIYHGQDSNPYGLNSEIGLCAFKLSLGYLPKLPETPTIKSFDPADIQEDFLVLNFPLTGIVITSATLYTTQENVTRYEMVTKYPDAVTVTTHIR